jgi:hypothetical protein
MKKNSQDKLLTVSFRLEKKYIEKIKKEAKPPMTWSKLLRNIVREKYEKR